MSNRSWEVSRAFVMIEKQSFGCFISWSPELWPQNSIHQAKSSTALINTKTSLLHDS
jgi:hypothetical protein